MAECIDGTVMQWDTIRATGHERLVNEAGFDNLPLHSPARRQRVSLVVRRATCQSPSATRLKTECDAMYRLRLWLAVAAMATAVGHAGIASAGFVTGTDLRTSCRPQKIDPVYRLKVAECRGYVIGVADSLDCDRPGTRPAWNSRATTSQEELVNTVLAWLDAHPESLGYQADGLVAVALSQAFPCP